MRSELCDGDVEKYLATTKPPKSIDEHRSFVQSFFLQIGSAMVAAEKELHVRHNDLKLLNVLVTKLDDDASVLQLSYAGDSGPISYKIPLLHGRFQVTDFGNATMNELSDGNPVTAGQVAT